MKVQCDLLIAARNCCAKCPPRPAGQQLSISEMLTEPKPFGAGELAHCPKGYFENPSPPDTSAEAWRCLYSAASARLLLRFSFILRRPTTMAFKTAGLTPLVMSARTSVR